MKHKVIYLVLGIVIILVGIYFVFGRQKISPEVSNSNQPGQIKPPQEQDAGDLSAENAPAPVTPPIVPPAGTTHFSDEEDIQPPPSATAPKRVAVVYDGAAFDPASITIGAGDTVVFRNSGSTPFRPASNPHPSHADYPGFDAKKELAPGETYEFVFTKVGRWSYHNHVAPAQGGTIIVTQ